MLYVRFVFSKLFGGVFLVVVVVVVVVVFVFVIVLVFVVAGLGAGTCVVIDFHATRHLEMAISRRTMSASKML